MCLDNVGGGFVPGTAPLQWLSCCVSSRWAAVCVLVCCCDCLLGMWNEDQQGGDVSA